MNFFTFSRTIQIRLVLQFITTTANAAVTPYLVVFFSSMLGTMITGFMFLSVMAANIAGSFTGGYIADKKGRKPVIVCSEAIVLGGFLFVAAVNSPWLSLPYFTFVLFVVIHFFLGSATPAYQAMIIDESTPENRKAVYTFSYWLQNLAISIGGITGAFLFMDHYFLLFLGVAAATMTSLVMTIFFIKESFQSEATSESKKATVPQKSLGNGVRTYFSVLRHKTFAVFTLANLLIVATEEQLTNYIGLRLADDIPEARQLVPLLPFQADGINLLGILKAENTILVVCLTVVVSYLLRRLNDRFVLLGGLVLYFLGYTVLSFHDSAIVLIAAMFFATLGELLHIPVKQTMLANMVPDHARSTYMAVFGLMTILGAVIAGLFIFLSSFLSTSVLTVAFLLMGTVTIVIFSRLTGRNASEKTRSAASQISS
ncbi:MFS transporter [Sediminibacillus dalangtanensis]|uniref:MFS transporter n=1 Tax=Sediminibacillus dalangtanensis TaxID=2729421 RepID=A0ABX7VTL6_9BACI|nr:MFS transporter [Sediminibacillus dalangtanensis]QTM98818.1 MFS transporter [Sediminibacillus dalangtanensis]